MIFLCLLEIYLNNIYIQTNNYSFEKNKQIDNNNIVQTYEYIKNIIIICTFGSLIYLLLHQINQNNDTNFRFEMYNKIIICIMIIDILICLFFLSKYLINYGIDYI